MKILEIAAKMSGFRCQFCKGSLMKVHYPKLYNMAHLLALNVLLLPKDLTIIFIYKSSKYLIAVRAIKSVDYIPVLITTRDINGLEAPSGIIVKSRKITGESMLFYGGSFCFMSWCLKFLC